MMNKHKENFTKKEIDKLTKFNWKSADFIVIQKYINQKKYNQQLKINTIFYNNIDNKNLVQNIRFNINNVQSHPLNSKRKCSFNPKTI